MRRISPLFFLICSQITLGQSWFPLGEGVRPQDTGLLGRAYVYALAVDSINNLLYVGGDFYYAGNTVSRELALWNGTNWISAETGNGFYSEPMRALLAKHDTIYYATGGVIAFYINDTARLGSGLPKISGIINSMTFFRDTLYAAGDFGIKKYNGKEWVKVGAQIGAGIPPYVDALCVYQDQLIIGGLFKTIGNLTVNNIAAWDGSQWHAMENGTRYSVSAYLGDITALAQYKGNLIASGSFDTAGTVVCEQFAQWDGKKWSPLDNNLPCSYALQMLPHDSLLYVVGNMASLGDCTTTRVATWNGSEWNGLNFYEADYIYSEAFFDGELTIGFNKRYYTADSNEQINNIARTDFATSIHSSTARNNSLKLYPNPASDQVTISFPFSKTTVAIYDLYGRKVEQMKIVNGNTSSVNIQNLAVGIYFIVLRDEKGNCISSQKFLKE